MPISPPAASPLPSSQTNSRPARSPHRRRNANNREWYQQNDNEQHDTLAENIIKVLAFMDTLHLDLGLLLWAMSWHVQEVSCLAKVSFERSALLNSDELLGIIRHWHHRPTHHGAGIRQHEGCGVLQQFAIELVEHVTDKEIRALYPFLELKSKDVNCDTILSLDIPKLKSSVKLHAPVLWRLLRHTAWTNQQEEHTLIKTPDFVSLKCWVLRAWTH
jgi:hypothetical protein